MAAGVSAILFSLAQVSLGTPKQKEKIIKNSAITINAPMVYMARDIMIYMRATSITRAIGRTGQKNLLPPPFPHPYTQPFGRTI